MAKRFENPLERKSAGTTAAVRDGVETIPYAQIRRDGGTQMRAQLDAVTVGEYRAVMEAAGDWGPFRPVVVIYDGEVYWLADGFHRLEAYTRAFADQLATVDVPAQIQTGQRRDAILYAAGANHDHGLRRSTADKERSVDTLLLDEEWGRWSDREIGRRCNVSHPFVAKRRALLVEVGQVDFGAERTYIDRHGNESKMSIGRIGEDMGLCEAPLTNELVTGNITSDKTEVGERMPLDLDETIDVIWHAVKRSEALVADHGDAAMPADERQLRWLEGITAADAKAAKEADDANPEWANRSLAYATYVQAVESVQETFQDRIVDAHAQTGDRLLEQADSFLVPSGGNPGAIIAEGEENPILPDDLRVSGWIVNEVAETGLYYGYQPRYGDRPARSTANTKEWEELIALMRTVEMSDESPEIAEPTGPAGEAVDWNMPVKLTISLGAVKASNRMLYGLAAAHIPKALLIELRTAYGEALNDVGVQNVR